MLPTCHWCNKIIHQPSLNSGDRVKKQIMLEEVKHLNVWFGVCNVKCINPCYDKYGIKNNAIRICSAYQTSPTLCLESQDSIIGKSVEH